MGGNIKSTPPLPREMQFSEANPFAWQQHTKTGQPKTVTKSRWNKKTDGFVPRKDLKINQFI